eukprot:TRINITY_DN6646_c1_g1_i1.p1 TRINITY_DN6646_c1_g1~~TRINITY_DN6646_c1_g1_i1.p1  ORF type:complete len:431 (-),score=60.39 TRINITY_DN6646_c1_g1_i1:213-1424(-)
MPRIDGRQTLLFSATMPDFQTKQFHSVLKAPPFRAKLRVGHYTEDERGGSCRHITQRIVRVRDMDARWERLARDLHEVWGSTRPRREGKGILFTNRIALAQPLERALGAAGISCGQLHGKQTQDVREDIVKRFRKGDFEMLIASNVASRGLDFPDIRIVVQFELPKTVEIYTHRIGRTGRNGQTGQALAYFQDVGFDKHLSKPLAEFLALNEQVVPDWLHQLAFPGAVPASASGGRRRSRSARRSKSRRRSRSRSRRRSRSRGRRDDRSRGDHESGGGRNAGDWGGSSGSRGGHGARGGDDGSWGSRGGGGGGAFGTWGGNSQGDGAWGHGAGGGARAGNGSWSGALDDAGKGGNGKAGTWNAQQGCHGKGGGAWNTSGDAWQGAWCAGGGGPGANGRSHGGW